MQARPRGILVLGRVASVEVGVHWRWWAMCALSVVLLAGRLLPVSEPTWNGLTDWATGAVAVLLLEGSLLAHELSHALVARGRGREVRQIIFHGFRAQTVLAEGCPCAPDALRIALAGCAANLLLVTLGLLAHLALPPHGAASTLALLAVVGNGLMLATSLAPIGESDGAQACAAARQMLRERRLNVSTYRPRFPVRARTITISRIRPRGDQPQYP